MAYVATNALQTRLREVLQDGAGSLRAITANTFGGNLPDGFSPNGDAVRSVALPQVECLISDIERSPNSPPLVGNVALYKISVRVRVVHRMPSWAQVSETDRDAVKANAAEAADQIAQALSWPGNLAATSGGTSTGLVSGMLSHIKSATQPVSVVDDGAAILATEHLFTGTLRSAPAVS